MRVTGAGAHTASSPSLTQGGSRVREFCTHGSGRGAVSNDRPYRTSCRVFLSLTVGHKVIASRQWAPSIPNGQFATNTAYFLINTQSAASGSAKLSLWDLRSVVL